MNLPTSPPISSSSRLTRATGLSAIPRRQSDLWNEFRNAVHRIHCDISMDVCDRDQKSALESIIDALQTHESNFAFPGTALLDHLRKLCDAHEWKQLRELTLRVAYMRARGSHRKIDLSRARARDFLELVTIDLDGVESCTEGPARPYFEVLVVDEVSSGDNELELRKELRAQRNTTDSAIFELVVVRSFEAALVAVTANPAINACVLRFSFPWTDSNVAPGTIEHIYDLLGEKPQRVEQLTSSQHAAALGQLIHKLRPELDLYRVTDAPVENVVGSSSAVFARIFYQVEDYLDLHTTILRGVADRFDTPFFDAIRSYSARPTGMFHALPVSRGRTIVKSKWIGDYGDFYGTRLFLAETSATAGGLDSLLQPTGPLKEAQRLAARAFGAHHTFFVTNGTSTANKIVFQALVRPRDFVLLGHDCHKSHPYAAILSGAYPVYLDGYPITPLSMYGGVPLREIKQKLLELRAAGALHRVRMLLLTNITFDGITYNPQQVMQELLAIHPDLFFLWDEAWFAYGRFSPLLAPRTAMEAARRLDEQLRSPQYRQRYDAWRSNTSLDTDTQWLDTELLPDPSLARVRVYATHSTHKTLTALRQGSMIHVYDSGFERHISASFREAYMTHTSTSPNYQILASLDVGRRQVELEGYGLVSESLDLALLLRERLHSDPLLSRYFKVATPSDMIPAMYRPSAVEKYHDRKYGRVSKVAAWREDEFVLDPTRVTVEVGRTGMDGDTFRRNLMDRHSIHINKTSRNSVLFLIHIGSARGTVAHLVNVLTHIAGEIEAWRERATSEEQAKFDERVRVLTDDPPRLPDFSRFHPCFADTDYPRAGDLRSAYFLGLEESACSFVSVDGDLLRRVRDGEELVSAGFVTPYPPGFPVLAPGQLVSEPVVEYLLALDVKEIHGLDATQGLRTIRADALALHRPPVATKT